MKARFQIDDLKLKEEKKKETKQQTLLPVHHFQKPTIPTPFDKISQVVNEHFISPMLDLEDIDLMQASQNLFHLYQKTASLKKLLHHVVYGEPKNAKAMIKKDPQLLLQTGTVTLRHTGQKFKGTALQIARYLKDEEMVAMFQRHMDLNDIEKQQSIQFPEGYEAYKKAEAEKVKESYKILEEIFEAIAEAKVEVDVQGNIIIDEQAKLALNRLRDYLKPKGVIETGQDITDEILLKAFELYDANYDRFSIHTPIQNLTHDSPKNMLAWRQIVGIVQFYLPINYIQDFCYGLLNTVIKKDQGKPQRRALTFKMLKGNKCVKSDLLTMVAQLGVGLGYHYGIINGFDWSGMLGPFSAPVERGVFTTSAFRDFIVTTCHYFQHLCQSKNSRLIGPPARGTHHKTEMACCQVM